MTKVKCLALSLALVFGVIGLVAQTPEWQWAVGVGGISEDNCRGIATDNQGNQYVTGSFSGTATFGPYTLTSSGSSDIFVAKLDPAGNWLWAIRAGGINGDSGWGIDIDGNGNIFVCGDFYDSAAFGPYTLTSNGGSDIFAAKLDVSGNWQLVTHAGGSYDDYGFGIVADTPGSACVTGSFRGYASFGLINLNAASSNFPDIFAAKFDTNGNWLWASKAGGIDYDTADDISLDDYGNLYLTGTFTGSASFGPYTAISSGGYDIFAAKLDFAGNWLWVRSMGGSGIDIGNSIAVDGAGNAYLTGSFQTISVFGPYTLTSSGSSDIFVAKLDLAGNWLLAIRAGGINGDSGWGIDLDSTGYVFLAGVFYGSSSFGSHTVFSSGGVDACIAKLDNAGNWLWAVSAGGPNEESVRGLSLDGAGDACIVGNFTDSITFGPYSLTSSGWFDSYISKMKHPPSAGFTSDLSSGHTPLVVQFIDQSSFGTFPIYAWFWTFGDGGTSTVQNPIHTYLNPGVYTVTLTVMDQNYQTSTLVRPDYITVVEQVFSLELLSEDHLSFGNVWLEEQSAWQTVALSNTGNVDLSLSEAYFTGTVANFELSEPYTGLVLPPGTQATLNVRFAPQQVGAVSDTLAIVNNSANQPLLKVRLTGTGEYVPLQIPQNVQVVMDGYDAVVSWDPVTQNLHGQPVTPDFYVVLYSEWPYDQADHFYYYLTSTTGLSALHYNVALFSQYMFYKVKAVKFYRDGISPAELDAWLEANLRPGMSEEEVARLMQ